MKSRTDTNSNTKFRGHLYPTLSYTILLAVVRQQSVVILILKNSRRDAKCQLVDDENRGQCIADAELLNIES